MKSILFVDDEVLVLEGLRSRLRRLSGKWTMEFVDSAALAIERMQERAYDVVVTDMRMPVMDGAALLEIVSARWPQAIRIVLSGYSEMQQTIRLVPFAHQYLSKPCQPNQLENVIERCLLLHGLLNEPRLRAIAGRIRKLPSLPRVYSELQAAATDETVTLGQIAKLVTADSALAARVLQIVNSAFFRLARRISSIEQAVCYLGFTAIRNLAMSVEVFSRWPNEGSTELDLGKLQAHAHSVAAAAGSLVARTPFADDTLLAGLLHDIGYWVLAQECPDDLTKAIDLAASREIPLYAAETEILGASHAEIGAYLLGIWGLPYTVVEAVAHHHRPDRVTHAEFDVLAATVIAHSLAPTDDPAAFRRRVPPDVKIDHHYLAAVKAPFDWDEALRRVSAATESEGITP